MPCFTSIVDVDLERAFAIFGDRDSGCRAYGVEHEGTRLFVKVATTDDAAASLRRASAFHRAVAHPVIVAPVHVHDGGGSDVRVISPWCEGEVLNVATRHGSDRSGLARFQAQPIDVVRAAMASILDAHLAVAAAGFVAVDLYDGSFLWDEATATMRLIDLDDYRPGPFVVVGDRLPGSLRYMAPEELRRGAVIDERTTVFDLGRTIHHLLDGPDGWRGSPAEADVVAQATSPEPADRFATVARLVSAWSAAAGLGGASTAGEEILRLRIGHFRRISDIWVGSLVDRTCVR